MSKYLELFKGAFDNSIGTKTKLENKPYIGYSLTGGMVYTVVPKPVVGPADNEIWYTSADASVITPYATDVFGANIVNNTYENGKGVITFDVNVTSIGYAAFYMCKNLTSITIPNSVTSIVGFAFAGCSSLKSIIVQNGNPIYNSRENCNAIIETSTNTLIVGCQNTSIINSVTCIGNDAFWGCSTLTSITIPNSVTRIGVRAFCNCTGFTSFTIPNSVTSIEERALQYCTRLTSITYDGTQDQWNTIPKGSNWNSYVPASYVQCTDGQVTL